MYDTPCDKYNLCVRLLNASVLIKGTSRTKYHKIFERGDKYEFVYRATHSCKNHIYRTSIEIVHFDTGAEGDYLAHVTFFARAKRVRKVT